MMKVIGWMIGLVLALVVIGGAGYMGYAQTASATPEVPTKPITVAVSQGDVQKTVTAPGQLVGTQEQLLSMGVNGRLAALNVRPGTIVQAGDLLAKIDPTPYENALEIAQMQLAQAEAAYQQQLLEAELAVASSEAQVGSAQAQIPSLTTAEINLQAARDAESRAAYEYQKAVDRHWETEQVKEAYRLEWVNTQQAVKIAEAQYNAVLSQQWGVSQQVEALQTDVEKADLTAQFLRDAGVSPLLQTAVSQAEKDLAATELVAPFTGVVLDVYVKPGASVADGEALILLADPTQGEVRTTVIEEDLSLVQVGQVVELFFDARPEVELQGQVSRIVPQRVQNEARPLYHVYISLEDTLPEGVFAGMTADASIIVDAEQAVLRLPRAVVQPKSDGTAVIELWRNGQRVEQMVSVGLKGDIFIAIHDGLQEGDEVVGE
mgnify:CR=1 FL=1